QMQLAHRFTPGRAPSELSRADLARMKSARVARSIFPSPRFADCRMHTSRLLPRKRADSVKPVDSREAFDDMGLQCSWAGTVWRSSPAKRGLSCKLRWSRGQDRASVGWREAIGPGKSSSRVFCTTRP